MRINKPADFWAGTMFLVVGTGAFYMALDYSIGTTRQMGPGYFPAALGILLALMGLVQIILSLGGPRQIMTAFAVRPVALVLMAAASFGVLLRPAGLFAAVAVAVLIAATASAQSKMWQALLLAAGLAAGSALVFVHYLGQPLPLVGSWLWEG